MSHLRESLNDLLERNFIASYNFYKQEGGNNIIASHLVFHGVS